MYFTWIQNLDTDPDRRKTRMRIFKKTYPDPEHWHIFKNLEHFRGIEEGWQTLSQRKGVQESAFSSKFNMI